MSTFKKVLLGLFGLFVLREIIGIIWVIIFKAQLRESEESLERNVQESRESFARLIERAQNLGITEDDLVEKLDRFAPAETILDWGKIR